MTEQEQTDQLEKLRCPSCKGRGYFSDWIQDEYNPEGHYDHDVCASCLGTGSEKYTYESMELNELHRQQGEMLEYINHIYSKGTKGWEDQDSNYDDVLDDVLCELHDFLESYDPERRAARAERNAGA